MKYLFSCALGVLVLVVIGGSPAGAQTNYTTSSGAGVQAKREVDVRVPAADEIQRLTLSDGSQIFGRVESIETDAVVFRSIAGVPMTVAHTNIADGNQFNHLLKNFAVAGGALALFASGPGALSIDKR